MIQEGLQLASGNYNFSTVCIQEVSLIVSNYFQETMFSVQENEIPNHNLLISRAITWRQGESCGTICNAWRLGVHVRVIAYYHGVRPR